MPARLPIPVGPSISTRPLPEAYSRVPDNKAAELLKLGATQLGEGVRAGAHAFGGAYTAYEKEKKDAKQDADNVRVGDSLTALQKRGTDELHGTEQPDADAAAEAAFDNRNVKEGFLASRGAKATDESVSTFERLEKKRQQLLEQLDNDEQKKAFKKFSDQQLERYYGQIESHAAGQRERQKLDTLKNAETEAVRAAQMDPANDKAAQASIGNIVGLQDSFTTSVGDSFAKAEEVQGKVSSARLDALLAQPGGFTDAERVFNANKNALARLGKADDYEKRITAAKLGGEAAVRADHAVLLASAAAGSKDFGAPDLGVLEQEIAKVPATPLPGGGTLQEKVATIARSRALMRKQQAEEEKEAFVDTAISIFNKNRATFFSTDIAERLNKVSPKTYGGLRDKVDALYERSKKHASEANREQKEQNDIALQEFKALPPEQQAKVSVDQFLTQLEADGIARGVNQQGESHIKAFQSGAKARAAKGLEEPATRFVGQYSAAIEKFAPPPGRTAKEKATYRSWWRDQKARATDAYADLVDPATGKKPTLEQLDAAKADLISGLAPNKSPESIKRSAEAIVQKYNPQAPARPTAAARARELKTSGLSREDIAKQLTAEGY